MSPRPARSFFSSLLRSATAAVLASFLIRIFFLWLSHGVEDGSHNRFISWGLEALMISESLAAGHGFANAFPHYPYVTAWLAPFYPWLLSWGVMVFHLHDHALVIFAQMLNVVFSALTSYPIYYLGKKIFSARVGLAAAWLWAVLPVAILMPIEWTWDESLSALLLALLLCYTYWLRETSSSLHWSGYGLLWGAAALTNPALSGLFPFLALWLWFQRRKNLAPSNSLLARAALFFLLVLLPWTVRNWFELGGLVFVKSDFGIAFWLGNNPMVKNTYSLSHHPMQNYAEYRFLVLKGEPAYNRLKLQDALLFIRANPRTFLKLVSNRFVDTWTGKFESPTDTYIRPLGIVKPYIWYTALSSLLAFAGLLCALWRNAGESLPLAVCVLFFPVPYYIIDSSLRYRHPIDPVMTILIALALASLASLLRRRTAVLPIPVSEPHDHEPVLA